MVEVQDLSGTVVCLPDVVHQNVHNFLQKQWCADMTVSIWKQICRDIQKGETIVEIIEGTVEETAEETIEKSIEETIEEQLKNN